jgi:hypothetical protein
LSKHCDCLFTENGKPEKECAFHSSREYHAKRELERRDAYAEQIEAAITKACPTLHAVLLRLDAHGFESMKHDVREVLTDLARAISQRGSAKAAGAPGAESTATPTHMEPLTVAPSADRAQRIEQAARDLLFTLAWVKSSQIESRDKLIAALGMPCEVKR